VERAMWLIKMLGRKEVKLGSALFTSLCTVEGVGVSHSFDGFPNNARTLIMNV
jgi:hypothetical protein